MMTAGDEPMLELRRGLTDGEVPARVGAMPPVSTSRDGAPSAPTPLRTPYPDLHDVRAPLSVCC